MEKFPATGYFFLEKWWEAMPTMSHACFNFNSFFSAEHTDRRLHNGGLTLSVGRFQSRRGKCCHVVREKEWMTCRSLSPSPWTISEQARIAGHECSKEGNFWNAIWRKWEISRRVYVEELSKIWRLINSELTHEII